MPQKSKFHKAYKLPLPILIKKAKNKFLNIFVNAFNRYRDKSLSTYSIEYVSPLKLSFPDIDIEQLLKADIIDEELIQYCNEVLAHKFKLLNDKSLKVSFDVEYDGFEGEKYDMRIRDFSHLQSRISNKNKSISTLAYNNISDNYDSMIDWQVDFRSGYRWNEATWYKDIQYGNVKSADIKVPWELCRMQHLPWLALAYSRTNEQKYAIEVIDQILDFTASNPPRYGVQWVTSMDVGIRMVNWLFALNILNNSEYEISENIREIINSSLYDHFTHIKQNIEFSEGMRGNHYFTNLCSILIFLAYIREESSYYSVDETDKYLKLLEKEILYQFNEDGSNFEASTRYHLLTAQMLFITIEFYNKIEKEVIKSDEVKQRIEKIKIFTRELLNFKNPPQIGDNDSGYFFKCINSKEHSLVSLSKMIDSDTKKPSHIKFENFGYYRISNGDTDLIVRCGDIGQKGKGGHSHNDQLSIILYANDMEFIVDPGTYVYTSNFDLRNKYRSTELHNALYIKRIEQNDLAGETKDDMFWIEEQKANPKVLQFSDGSFKGKINYADTEYIREIKLADGKFYFTDEINKNIEKSINLHLHPEVEVVEKDNIIELKRESVVIAIKTNESTEIEEYYYSPEYGIKIPSKRVRIISKESKIQWQITRG